MNCEICGEGMEYQYTHYRGRHKREVYFCKKCSVTKSKKVNTIPYNKKKKKIVAVQKPYVPWGKAKHPRQHPKKKKGRK